MPDKHYGRASYKAFRAAEFLHIIASGETPNLNDQVIIEQLPFLIRPPMFGLFWVTQDISLPALRPFTVEIRTLFPGDTDSVRIQDADGDHVVPIADIAAPPSPPSDVENKFCVFEWIEINPHVIAEFDAIVPAVYSRAFGPDTRARCVQYIRDQGGV